jgi:adenosylmethionine-8-amino-7-oxononanoate aminotransferase
MVYSGLGHVEVRGRLSKLFAEICPGDINGFMFPSSGNEANECAIRMARRFTGKQKIMTRYRSYHGGSGNTLTMTGDYRRHFQQQDAPGMVKFFDPTPLNFSWGRDEETDALQSLAALNDQIMAEGPDTIAAIFIETVPGSAGVLIPPKGYIEGVRALCDKHGILMIADEVMVGFGRTGQMFGFQNFEGVVPDIVTFAKGISGAYLPLSGVGYRQEIKDFFDVNPLGWGATYNAHPVAMACGYETMKYLLDKDIVGHAKSMEVVMKEELQKLVTKHAVVKQARCLGLFGCMDFANPDGSLIQNVGEAPGEKTLAFKAKMADVGLYAFFRPPQFHCAPPLIITEEELRDGFSRVDECLEVFSE